MSNSKQLDRFKDAAKNIEADQSDDALGRVMGKLDLTRKSVSDSNEKCRKPKE